MSLSIQFSRCSKGTGPYDKHHGKPSRHNCTQLLLDQMHMTRLFLVNHEKACRQLEVTAHFQVVVPMMLVRDLGCYCVEVVAGYLPILDSYESSKTKKDS